MAQMGGAACKDACDVVLLLSRYYMDKHKKREGRMKQYKQLQHDLMADSAAAVAAMTGEEYKADAMMIPGKGSDYRGRPGCKRAVSNRHTSLEAPHPCNFVGWCPCCRQPACHLMQS